MTLTLVGALAIGITLGMLGSGGSAITVPVLVYIVGHGAKESIAESMAIVGLISVIAAIPYARARQIDWRSVVFFGIPGMFGTLLGAWLGGLSRDAIQLVVFGLVLIGAAYSMLRKSKSSRAADGSDVTSKHVSPAWKIGIEGSLVGVLTGFVGVGGGFLIVPALVLLGRLPIRLAIGTSLVIIAFKSAVGFAKYEHYLMAHEMSVDLRTIAAFTLIGMLGSVMGRVMNARLDQQMLKHAFAGFLILLGAFVIVREGSKFFSSKLPSATISASTSFHAAVEVANDASGRGFEPVGRILSPSHFVRPPAGREEHVVALPALVQTVEFNLLGSSK